MTPLSAEAVAHDARRLLNEEAHLIGLEVQGSLGHAELHRLDELAAVLDDLTEQFAGRRMRHPRRSA